MDVNGAAASEMVDNNDVRDILVLVLVDWDDSPPVHCQSIHLHPLAHPITLLPILPLDVHEKVQMQL